MNLIFCFNSKVVRLKVDGYELHRQLITQFQFQSGAVKRKTQKSLFYLLTLFQFQSGAVKSIKPSYKATKETFVSIPKWCG